MHAYFRGFVLVCIITSSFFYASNHLELIKTFNIIVQLTTVLKYLYIKLYLYEYSNRLMLKT